MAITSQPDISGDRQSGQDVRTQNVMACQAIANIVKSSLGPVGLDKDTMSTSERRPTKKMSKSQAAKLKGKSTAAEPEAPPQVIPTISDPSAYGIVLSTEEHRKRFDKMIKRGVVATRYGDPQILETMDIRDNVNELLNAAGLAKCLAPRPTYLKFVLEFFSTLELWDNSTSCQDMDYSITFQLLNEKRTLHNTEIADIYGFEEQSIEERASLASFDVQQFWGQITAAPENVTPMAYDPRHSRLTEIRSPVVKYLQKLLSATFCARKEVSSPRQLELELLWAIVDRHLRDSQQDLLHCFEKVIRELKTGKKKEPKVPDPVYCGALITPILDHYNIPLPSYEPITQAYLLSWDEMENMRIAVQGYRRGSSGPPAPYVLQNEGPYLRLPNTALTYIRNLSSTENLQLVSAAHKNESVDPESDEITKFGRGKKTRPMARGRAKGGEGEGGGQAAPRKRPAASVLSQAEFQERTEGLLSAMGDDIKELRSEMGELRDEVKGMKESQNKLLESFQSIKGCFTPSSSRPSRSL